MEKSLARLLENIIDYAGTFPPAALPLKRAIDEFVSYRSHPQKSWIARFVLPISALNDFENIVESELRAGIEPWHFSFLVKNAQSKDELFSLLRSELAALHNFLALYPNTHIDALELLLPSNLATESTETLRVFFGELAAQFHTFQKTFAIFCEVPLSNSENLENVLRGLALHNAGSPRKLSAKLRTGALKAEGIPSADCLADGILRLAKHGIPFKCTAGLHHPMRHFDESVGGNMHGILNVWAAALFAYKGEQNLAVVRQVLEDENIHNFQFDNSGFRYKHTVFTIADIENCRNNFALSLGSCSFLEPVDYLSTLNML